MTLTEQEILAKFNEHCGYSHKLCKNVNNEIIKRISLGFKPTTNFLTRYINYLIRKPQYGYHQTCLKKSVTWIPVIQKIFEFVPATNIHFTELLDSYNNGNCALPIFETAKENGHVFTIDVLNSSLMSKSSLVTLFLLKSVVPTSESLRLACENKIGKEVIKEILNYKIRVTPEILKTVLKKSDRDTCELLLANCDEIDIEMLELACEKHFINIIKQIIEHKITPNQKCFNGLFKYASRYAYGGDQPSYTNIPILIDILVAGGYEVTYNDVVLATQNKVKINNIDRFDIKFDQKFLQICAKAGFYPYTDIGVEPNIKCLEEECKRSSNLTTIKDLIKKGIKPNHQCLLNACSNKSNVQTIKFLVEKCGLRVDQDCLIQYAKQYANTTFNYLFKSYKNPTLIKNQCEVCYEAFGTKPELKKHKKSCVKPDNKQELDIDALFDLEDEIILEEKIDKNTESNQSDSNEDIIIKEESEDMVETTDSLVKSCPVCDKVYKTKRGLENHLKKSPCNPEYEIVAKVATKKVPAKKATAKKTTKPAVKKTPVKKATAKKTVTKVKGAKNVNVVDDEEDMEDVDESIQQSTPKSIETIDTETETEEDPYVPTETVDGIEVAIFRIPLNSPTNKRKKESIPTKVLELLGKKDNEEMSFIILRKLLIEYVSKTGKVHDKKKNLVKPDKKISEMFKLKDNTYIDFNKLDDFINQCYGVE